MSDEEGLSLNPQWRARIKAIGKMNFVREEMLRLGFYPTQKLDEKEKQQLQAALAAAYPRLAEFRKELSEINSQVNAIDDVEILLKEIRHARIERVKQERAERKARKEREHQERQARWNKFKAAKPPFLGVGVSARLQFSGGDLRALQSRGLPQPVTAEDLAALMEISTGELSWLCYERAAASVDHYTRFEIPKRSGGTRLISSPKPKLRTAQGWVLNNILGKLTLSPAATAFRPGGSIVANAAPHLDTAIIVRMDFKDFFPTITFPRVRGFFESTGFNPGIATLLALIATDAPRVKATLDGEVSYVAMGKRSLPQGACTSPALANLISRKLDFRLLGLCGSLPDKWVFTRYADDLTFSAKSDKADVARLLRAVRKIVIDEGFNLNEGKTAVMRSPGRRMVTGLVVDKELRLSRRDLRRFRAFLHRCNRDGLQQVSEEMGKDALSVARGHLSYIQMIMPNHAEKLREKHPWLCLPES